MKNKLYIIIFEYICGILLGIMLIVILVQILFRGYLNFSLSWTEELARYIMIWFTYIGAIVCLWQGSHITIDVLIRRLSPKWQKYTRLTSNLLILFFLLVLFREGQKLVIEPMIINQLTPGLRISKSYLYSVIPFCTSIMIIILFVLIVKDARELLIINKKMGDE
jgi:C4-dicarboxylate transporter DctQ subunit